MAISSLNCYHPTSGPFRQVRVNAARQMLYLG